ncbi:MAG: segregation and condensation protein B [Parcubacteria group bacterium Gr01-1014_38]|nr:MAG: segregation and condensation protein B [Parcubacteria group bacterium Gr01-1014_38]
MELSTQLEAALFVAGEPVPLLTLARAFNVSQEGLRGALTALEKRYEATATGIRLLRSPEGVQLVTVPEAHEAVEAFVTHSIRERLTPAAAETLALIAYRGPISRAGIEAIRGVNSSFTLRLLALRGLVTREPHPKDRRSFVYQVSAEFLRHLGVTAVDELPDYAQLHAHAGMTTLTEAADGSSAPGSPT